MFSADNTYQLTGGSPVVDDILQNTCKTNAAELRHEDAYDKPVIVRSHTPVTNKATKYMYVEQHR